MKWVMLDEEFGEKRRDARANGADFSIFWRHKPVISAHHARKHARK
jgi:hypothetical protein